MKGVLFLAMIALTTEAVVADSDQTFPSQVDPFVSTYCYQCHDAREEQGDFRLDILSRDIGDAATAIAWQDAIDLIKLGEMPPPDEPQPASEELEAFLTAVEVAIQQATAASSKPQSGIRRLSQSALQNTVQDLIGTGLSITKDLPPDAEIGGFNNLGQGLELTDTFMSVLQVNARRIARNIIAPADQADPRMALINEVEQLGHGKRVIKQDDELLVCSSRSEADRVWLSGFSAPWTGVYRIRIEACQYDNRDELDAAGKSYVAANAKSALNQGNFERFRIPAQRPRMVAIKAESSNVLGAERRRATPGRELTKIAVSDHYDSYEVECVLEKGENVFVQAVDCLRTGNTPLALVDGDEMLVGEICRVREMKIEGPLVESWPSELQQSLLARDSSSSNSDSIIGLSLKEKKLDGLHAFLTRAFRRPVESALVQRYQSIYDLGIESGLDSDAAMRNVVEAVLCSPRFLYNSIMHQGADDAWGLASRLSYFLWNSMPDDELLQLADSGDLLDENVLEEQVRRMLDDPKSQRFVVDFCGQWLGLRRVGAMLPDPKLYPNYDPVLEQSIRGETESLFREILAKDLPITDFLTPDYAMLNDRLARHYGIEGVVGRNFRPVPLPSDHPRGGLLGHASMLTLTSNGTRTSPVVRGVWVLENLLDSPPAPPPPDVEPIEPDVRGATTIREMLAKHSESETCNTCHRRIDPWGFGLENFDAIGEWRDHYAGQSNKKKNGKRTATKGKPVDASGTLADGGTFEGVIGLRNALLSKQDRFAHALTSKLWTHALGRPPDITDRVAIDQIVAKNKVQGSRLADLISLICTSPSFRE
ncbi:hypothetical protein Pla22_25960 [Rubripirellula amarantea]|uniref:Planctomycete cytochrome C n=1 Tax=Rubripirellula amarantea TaxID=2527999 RepID=A0A5C5WYH2_9BACT|nr:DUF1592 domain-containing protein [Rubripirellula amarantea]TWT54942.1 hypothetical protein Pla22_25960 [Rubripirellula amarantea]